VERPMLGQLGAHMDDAVFRDTDFRPIVITNTKLVLYCGLGKLNRLNVKGSGRCISKNV